MCVFWQEQARATKKPLKHQEKCLDCDQGREIAAELVEDKVIGVPGSG